VGHFDPAGERCRRERLWLSQRVDGTLSHFERRRLDRHLARCPDCRAFEALLVDVTDALRTAPPEVPLSSLRLPVRRRASLQVRAALALACVGLAAIGFSVSGSVQTRPEVVQNTPPLSVDDHAKDPGVPPPPVFLPHL